MKSKNNTFTVIDVGTTKIICLIATIDNNDNLKVIGHGHYISQGFRAGGVIDIKLAENSVFKAIESAEKMAGINIDKAIVSINASKIESNHVESSLILNGHPVTNKDINKLIDQVLEQSIIQNQDLVSYFPLEYSLDNEKNIHDPRLMFGNTLGCKLHIVTSPSNILLNLVNCFARCHIDIQDFTLSAYASSLACLTKDEIDLGSVLIDMGGATTSIAIFNEGNIVSSGAITVGGMHITSDIAHGLSLNIKDSERIKILYGNAIKSNFNDYEIVDLYPENENEISYIKVKELINIVNPRVEEIFEMIKKYLFDHKISKMIAKNIVLTGGASQLTGTKEIVQQILGGNVRIANPKTINGLDAAQINPIFSASIGMLVSTYNKYLQEKYKIKDEESKHLNYFKKIFNWF